MLFNIYIIITRENTLIMTQKCYTITYGDVAENHARMQKIGELHDRGYKLNTMLSLRTRLRSEGLDCNIYALHTFIDVDVDVDEAYILVIHKGVQHILHTNNTLELMEENEQFDMDKFALMRGRVVNKRARWNLCFADFDQEPNYEDGKGRVVSWDKLPLMSKVRERIAEWTDDSLLNGEGNYYYDIEKCGIGFHGDAERRKVFAMRMGATMPLYYQWYQNSQKIGPMLRIDLEDGDMYMMSEKAVGFDWMKKKVLTLRHAAGCPTFTK